MRRIDRRRLGIDKVVEEIENVLMGHPLVYDVWIEISERSRRNLKREFKRMIKRELLGEEFTRALVRDCLNEKGEIVLESEVFKYVKRRVYKGNLREMLGELVAVANESCEKNRRERRWETL